MNFAKDTFTYMIWYYLLQLIYGFSEGGKRAWKIEAKQNNKANKKVMLERKVFN
jgi:hypothetical protein